MRSVLVLHLLVLCTDTYMVIYVEKCLYNLSSGKADWCTGQVTLNGRDVLALRAPVPIFSLFVVQQSSDPTDVGVS